MAARTLPRDHRLLAVDYCAAQVDAIMRTDDTWMCWALDEAELPVDDAPPGALLDVVPGAPAVAVDPAPLLELAAASVPVISTW